VTETYQLIHLAFLVAAVGWSWVL